MSMPRMRTIPEAMKEIQTADPHTALTLTALRRAVKQGKIPFIEVCSKKLLNMDDVYAFMTGSKCAENCINIYSGIKQLG